LEGAHGVYFISLTSSDGSPGTNPAANCFRWYHIHRWNRGRYQNAMRRSRNICPCSLQQMEFESRFFFFYENTDDNRICYANYRRGV